MSHTENQFPKRPRLSEPLLPTRKPNHKNEPCLQFQRGSCIYGDRCCFTHDIEQLKGLNKLQQLMTCDENKNPRCGEKTKLCWRFMSGEKCVYGDKCHFIHWRSEGRSGAISVLPWRTKLCNRWMETGSCKYGRICCFAHGISELQNQGLNDGQDYADGGPFKLVDKNMEGKGLKVKWKSNERISQVYADWINDMPLVSHTI